MFELDVNTLVLLTILVMWIECVSKRLNDIKRRNQSNDDKRKGGN